MGVVTERTFRIVSTVPAEEVVRELAESAYEDVEAFVLALAIERGEEECRALARRLMDLEWVDVEEEEEVEADPSDD